MNATARTAFRFVLMIGFVNLIADFTYEGGRSIAGPFLGSLGASATVIGFVAGLGELLGYALRSLSGYFADRTHRYWPLAFVGYAINQLAIPALAFTFSWPAAAACVVAERTGRAIRKPAMDAMLSHAGQEIGAGWVFGLNEALDQAGAALGPLLVALVLYLHHSDRFAFAIFFVPALLCLATVGLARRLHPRPDEFEPVAESLGATSGLSRNFWLYVIAGALTAAGLADFSLIGFHFQNAHIIRLDLVPIYYAAAMASGALSSLVFGRLFDRYDKKIVLLAFTLSALFAPFVFLGNATLAFLGMILWGIGIGVEGSLLRALITRTVPASRRSTAFGLFDTCYGVAWFAGSAAMGLLYDRSLLALVIFSVVSQVVALPLFFRAR
jgi:MFS family permease